MIKIKQLGIKKSSFKFPEVSMEDINTIVTKLNLNKATATDPDRIPHDVLIAKPNAYGLTMETLTFLYSYLKRRKQRVKLNDAESIFKILLS